MISAVLRSPWARDGALAAAAFAAGLFVLVALPGLGITWDPRLPEPSHTLSAGVLAVACAGVLLRRRLPVAALALTAAALVVGIVPIGHSDVVVVLALTDALYCSVLYTSRQVSRAVCVVTAVPVAGLPLLSLVSQSGQDAVRTLLNMMVVAVPVVWAYEVRRHRDLAEVQRARADQASRMAEMDRAAAVAAERARMARDLHDVVAGQISAIALQSEAALEHHDPDLRDRVLRGVREASVSALAEMRTMIGLLREDAPPEPRTAPARLDQIGPLLTSARAWGLEVRVRDERAADVTAAAGVELAAYRIVQEGLTNVAKHAPGAQVSVLLRHDGDRLEVSVTNGAGRSGAPAYTADTSSGTGLDGLAERAAAVGGTVHGRPAGAGWILSASLPSGGAPAAAGRDRTQTAAG